MKTIPLLLKLSKPILYFSVSIIPSNFFLAAQTNSPKPIESSAPSPSASKAVSTNSISFPEGTVANVITRTLDMKSSSESTADLVATLKEGDSVTVLERKGGLLRVKYLLDKQFPIEGWVSDQGLTKSVVGQTKEAFTPNYIPEEPKAAPNSELSAPNLTIDPPKPSASTFKGMNEEIPKPQEIEKFSNPNWRHQGSLHLGYAEWTEAIQTKDTLGNAEPGPYLAVAPAGIAVEAQWSSFYRWKQVFLGGLFRYKFVSLTSDIESTALGITNQKMIAQYHRISIAPKVLYSWQSPWEFQQRPIIFGATFAPQISYNLFQTNQLSVNSAPILFGHQSLMIAPELEVAAEWRKAARIRPFVRPILFQDFEEQATVLRTPESTSYRTGASASPGMTFPYGVEVSWLMDSIHQEVYFRYETEEQSISFSGSGLRAGKLNTDSQVTIQLDTFSLGYKYTF